MTPRSRARLSYLRHRLIESGQESRLIAHDVIFGSNYPTVLELCEWLKFLDNPLGYGPCDLTSPGCQT
jgi:hypothetical protein